ncbi:unnamed protein product [Ambrosiozyma monospora]|uniref:Unnamed protein product n=1 Tax=Ambrosiozyma monospora TaxID=43982 RepID=A0ACB5SZI9_AMBMO|nr:unnamed protein product [Ambrosiozyma monospora]
MAPLLKQLKHKLHLSKSQEMSSNSKQEVEQPTPTSKKVDQPTPKKSICIFCGSSSGNSSEYTKQATQLGKLLAEKNYGLIYGGGTTGLMGAVAKSARSNGGYVHGIIPRVLVEKERPNDFAQDQSRSKTEEKLQTWEDESLSYGSTTMVDDIYTRKQLMGKNADGGFVAMPGGYGTLEEVMEVISWSRMGVHSKPIVFFNINGLYDKFIQYIEDIIEAGFMSKDSNNIFKVANTAEEVIEQLDTYVVPEGRFTLNWNDHK